MIHAVCSVWKSCGLECRNSMTSEYSQANLFADLAESTLSAEGRHASQRLLPAKAAATRTRVGCGRKRSGSSAKSSQDGSSLRTHLAYAAEVLTGFSAAWKRQDTPAGRSYYRLTLPDCDITVSDFGLWPTPTATDCHGYKTFIRKRIGGGTLRLNHWLYIHGREDLAHSPKFRATLMGFPEDYHQALEAACCEYWATHGRPSRRC